MGAALALQGDLIPPSLGGVPEPSVIFTDYPQPSPDDDGDGDDDIS